MTEQSQNTIKTRHENKHDRRALFPALYRSSPLLLNYRFGRQSSWQRWKLGRIQINRVVNPNLKRETGWRMCSNLILIELPLSDLTDLLKVALQTRQLSFGTDQNHKACRELKPTTEET